MFRNSKIKIVITKIVIILGFKMLKEKKVIRIEVSR